MNLSRGVIPESILRKGLCACRDAKPQYSGDTPEQDVSLLFQPHKLGPFQLSNRMVYAPLTRCRAIDSNPQDNMIEYYQQRAHGSEGGLILAEGTVISDTGYG